MFQRALLVAGVMLGSLFAAGGPTEARADGFHHGFHHYGHRAPWVSGPRGGGYVQFQYRPRVYPQPYCVPYVVPPPVYVAPPPYYYYRPGPGLFIGSGGLSLRIPV
jgi:hypothetical protein